MDTLERTRHSTSVRRGASATAQDIVAEARSQLASYKLPKCLVIVAQTPRAPNGKADYATAKALFAARA